MVGSSVTRVFNTLISVVNFAISENALDLKNPFIGLYHDRNPAHENLAKRKKWLFK